MTSHQTPERRAFPLRAADAGEGTPHPNPPSSPATFMDRFGSVIETATKLKKVMLKKGLTRARCECPRCGSFIHGRIAGPRNHLHMACEGGCGMSMME